MKATTQPYLVTRNDHLKDKNRLNALTPNFLDTKLVQIFSKQKKKKLFNGEQGGCGLLCYLLRIGKGRRGRKCST